MHATIQSQTSSSSRAPAPHIIPFDISLFHFVPRPYRTSKLSATAWSHLRVEKALALSLFIFQTTLPKHLFSPTHHYTYSPIIIHNSSTHPHLPRKYPRLLFALAHSDANPSYYGRLSHHSSPPRPQRKPWTHPYPLSRNSHGNMSDCPLNRSSNHRPPLPDAHCPYSRGDRNLLYLAGLVDDSQSRASPVGPYQLTSPSFLPGSDYLTPIRMSYTTFARAHKTVLIIYSSTTSLPYRLDDVWEAL